MKEEEKSQKNPHAVALGRKGGRASRKYIDPDTRRRLAQKAARARWDKYRERGKLQKP